jgi:hypothetical protein
VCAVGHYLEDEGIPTASISLVREHSEVMKPPRALWVPFMLGRPLGAPNSPAFQRSVLHAVLRLFERPSGPVLEDFPLDAPASAEIAPEDAPGESCPVNFGRSRTAGAPALADELDEEIAQLRPWHDLAKKRRGGSVVGVSGMPIEQAGAFVASFLGTTPPVNPQADRPLGLALKLAVDDLRAYYEEAAAAQPGEPSPGGLQQWLYRETVVGEILLAVRQRAFESTDESVRALADRSLIPRAVLQAPAPQA